VPVVAGLGDAPSPILRVVILVLQLLFRGRVTARIWDAGGGIAVWSWGRGHCRNSRRRPFLKILSRYSLVTHGFLLAK
jgi:hypothetical protein